MASMSDIAAEIDQHLIDALRLAVEVEGPEAFLYLAERLRDLTEGA